MPITLPPGPYSGVGASGDNVGGAEAVRRACQRAEMNRSIAVADEPWAARCCV
jgi:hypothetical protein